jgi:hypothetical protein
MMLLGGATGPSVWCTVHDLEVWPDVSRVSCLSCGRWRAISRQEANAWAWFGQMPDLDLPGPNGTGARDAENPEPGV